MVDQSLIVIKYNGETMTFLNRNELDDYFNEKDWNVYVILQWLGRDKFRNLEFTFKSDQLEFEILETKKYQMFSGLCPN